MITREISGNPLTKLSLAKPWGEGGVGRLGRTSENTELDGTSRLRFSPWAGRPKGASQLNWPRSADFFFWTPSRRPTTNRVPMCCVLDLINSGAPFRLKFSRGGRLALHLGATSPWSSHALAQFRVEIARVVCWEASQP